MSNRLDPRRVIPRLLAQLVPREATNTVTAAGSAQTIPDPTVATINRYTLTAASCAFTAPAAIAGFSFSVSTVQDATGGRLATWDASVRWPGHVAPTLTAAANAVDTFWFVCFVTGRWEAGPGGKDHG